MNRDDHFSLNDYLDGRLEPQHQHAIESSCVTNPRLAEELRELSVVRDLVAGLSREQSVNLTTKVMERVRLPRRRKPNFLSLPRSRPLIAAIGGGLVVAASVMAVTTMPWTVPSPMNRADRVGQTVQAALDEGPKVAGPVDGLVSSIRPTTLSAEPDLPQPSAKLVVAAKPAAVEDRSTSTVSQERAPSSRTIEELTHLLDNQNLRQIFVVSDSKDGFARQRVASLVEQTTHFDYFAITVAQGLVIDPMHPDQATVFALIIDPTQLANLREQLKAAVKTPVEEQKATPEILTQLADLGDVESFKPSVPGPVTIPRSEIAYRTTSSHPSAAEPLDPDREGTSILLGQNRGPAPASPTSHPALPPSRRTPTADRLPPDRAVESSHDGRLGQLEHDKAFDPENVAVVLIWVHRPRAG